MSLHSIYEHIKNIDKKLDSLMVNSNKTEQLDDSFTQLFPMNEREKLFKFDRNVTSDVELQNKMVILELFKNCFNFLVLYIVDYITIKLKIT